MALRIIGVYEHTEHPLLPMLIRAFLNEALTKCSYKVSAAAPAVGSAQRRGGVQLLPADSARLHHTLQQHSSHSTLECLQILQTSKFVIFVMSPLDNVAPQV